MKKLMIAAVAVATIGAANAAGYIAQVYDFSATLKTTTCKEAKVSAALAKYFDDNGVSADAGAYAKGDKVGLRKQASRKLLGVIWGCNCPTIENPQWRIYNSKTVGGYMFWDQAIDDYLRVVRTTFEWKVLNRIDAMNKCEGMFKLFNDVDGQAIMLAGAGFGSVKDNGCSTYVKSISGSVVGVRQPNDGDFSGCVFCQAGNGCVVEALCDVCDDVNSTADKTVAFGTWSIKFNSSMSKKLAKNGYLSQVYKFKKAGDAQVTLAGIEAYVYNNGSIPDVATEDDGEVIDIADIDGLEDEDGKLLFPLETEGVGYEVAEDWGDLS